MNVKSVTGTVVKAGNKKGNVVKNTQKFASVSKNMALGALSSMEMLMSSYERYKTTVQIETTKREQISAVKDIQISKIQAQKELLRSYLDQTFAERRSTINELFMRLDQAIDSGDVQQISVFVNGITDIVKT